MKSNKKLLISLLSAACAIAGVIGLAACKPEVSDPEPLKLTTGKNDIGLSTDALATQGVIYSFTSEAGSYVFEVTGENAKVTVDGSAVDGTAIIELTASKTSAEVKCATADGKAGTYSISISALPSFSIDASTQISLPKAGKTAFMNATVATGKAGAYTLAFAFDGNDSMAKYTFTVNGNTASIGENRSYSFVARLNEGDNLIALTSTLANDSTATLSFTAIPSGGSLTTGENASLTFENADTFYAYTFTAAENGDYTLSVPSVGFGESTLCITDSEGNILLSENDNVGEYDDDWVNIISNPIPAKAGEAVILMIKADCGGDSNILASSYTLTISKFIPATVNADGQENEIAVSSQGTKVILNVETAGTYVLTIDPDRMGSITLGEKTFDMFNTTLEIELNAGENEIVLIYVPRGPSSSGLAMVSLTAKA